MRMPFLAALSAPVLPLLVIWAAVADNSARIIPNKIHFWLCAAFFVFAATAGLGVSDMALHALCAFIALASGFVLFSFGVTGAGDAKLIAAVALWLGFDLMPAFLASTAIAGGVLSLFYLYRKMLVPAPNAPEQHLCTVPYAVAIAAGVVIVFPDWLASF